MIRKKPFFNKQRDFRVDIVANHRIRFPEVRVLDEHGEMIGIMPIRDAMNTAQDAEKDLVLVTAQAKPPVVKVIELAKYKYQLQQKEAESRKKSKSQDTKEIQFTPFMGEGDIEYRLKKIIDYLEKGDKVRLSLEFKGRAITKKEFGYEVINKVIAQTSEIAKVEIQPRLMGKKLMAQLMPVKK